MRAGFTILEATIALALFSGIGYVLVDVLSTENKNAQALVEDLQVDADAQKIFSQISRDVRSATEIVLDPATQVNPPANTVGIDERLSRLVLRYAAPVVEAQALRRWQVEYRLVGKTQGPPPGLPNERASKYTFLGQGEKWVYPLVREVSTLEAGVPKSRELKVIGHVRELSFYRTQPALGLEVAASPVVQVKLTMAAFKPGPGGAMVEAYREELATALTARALVPSLVGRLP